MKIYMKLFAIAVSITWVSKPRKKYNTVMGVLGKPLPDIKL